MAISQSSIRCPHDFMQPPELGKETRDLVVDLCGISRYYEKVIMKTCSKVMRRIYVVDAWRQSRHTTASFTLCEKRQQHVFRRLSLNYVLNVLRCLLDSLSLRSPFSISTVQSLLKPPAKPVIPYAETSSWKPTSEISGRTSCECIPLSVATCLSLMPYARSRIVHGHRPLNSGNHRHLLMDL
jgi:hypothetical protein